MRKQILPAAGWLCSLFPLLVFLMMTAVYPLIAGAQVTVVQLSDTHIGLSQAPHASANLRQAVAMINALHPDAVVVTGDIGEGAADWQIARSILKGLTVPLFLAPGNHDVHLHNVAQYRSVFGPDYYRFDVRGVIFLVIDSQLLGNFENFNAKTPPPLPPDTLAESARMILWLNNQAASIPAGATVIGIQHVPMFRDGGFPDGHPYWIVNEPFHARELAPLQKMHVKHMLVGHWHNGKVFNAGGITWHAGPATSWLPQGGHLGFAVHTISSQGDVKTEFVNLPGAKP